MYILPYKNGSTGANDLAKALGVKQIKREGSKFKGSEDKLVINWGSSTSTDEVDKCTVLNKPMAVATATNKLSCFTAIYNAMTRGEVSSNIPRFWTRKSDSKLYIQGKHKVVCRQTLTGHSGEGIVIASTLEELVDAPLYVQYIPKKREYRVHVFGGVVVDVQRKARDHAIPDEQVNWQVRNHQNGFIYVRDEDISSIPPNIMSYSLGAIQAVGLDFGAVDVVYNESSDNAVVLEINTAPGLSGVTLEGYKQRFAEHAQQYAPVKARPRKSPKTYADRIVNMIYDDPALQARFGEEITPVRVPQVPQQGNEGVNWYQGPP